MRKRHHVLAFIREIAIVIIGVLIAVSISNYKEELDNKTYLEKTLSAIENEVLSSKGEVDTVLTRHINLYTKLENEMGTNDLTIGEFVSSSGGFQVAPIMNVSLRFFIANKADLLSYEIISQLLDIELKTNALADKIERLSDFAYDHVNESSDEVMVKFNYLLANVIDGEQTLLAAYSAFLEENEAYLSRKGN